MDKLWKMHCVSCKPILKKKASLVQKKMVSAFKSFLWMLWLWKNNYFIQNYIGSLVYTNIFLKKKLPSIADRMHINYHRWGRGARRPGGRREAHGCRLELWQTAGNLTEPNRRFRVWQIQEIQEISCACRKFPAICRKFPARQEISRAWQEISCLALFYRFAGNFLRLSEYCAKLYTHVSRISWWDCITSQESWWMLK